MKTEEMKEKIKNTLIDKLSPQLIYIFGSVNKNRVRGDSDIDIAILTDDDIDEYSLFLIAQDLTDGLKREVDLVDLKKASTVFRAEILRTGCLIYYSDNLKKMEFQLSVLKDYAFLNERRKVIIDKIKNRKYKGIRV